MVDFVSLEAYFGAPGAHTGIYRCSHRYIPVFTPVYTGIYRCSHRYIPVYTDVNACVRPRTVCFSSCMRMGMGLAGRRAVSGRYTIGESLD